MSVTVRELSHRTRDVLLEVERDRRRILVTSNGRPVAILMPIDADELLDRALEAFVPSEADVTRELTEDRTRNLADVVKELGL